MTEPFGAANADYVGEETQIGGGRGGMKPLAQHGQVVIAQGMLTLYGTKGDVIDSAPLANVEVKKSKLVMGQGVFVQINGKKYFLSVGHGAGVIGPMGEPGSQMAMSIEGTRGFVEAFQRLSGKKV